MKPPLYAVIGVAIDGRRTFCVRRSDEMENYPGVWSLLSVQTLDGDMKNPLDLEEAQASFDRLSQERLGGAPLKVLRHIKSNDSDQMPIDYHTYLHMYEVYVDTKKVVLDSHYYTECAWLTQAEISKRNRNLPCGLCLQMLTDYGMGLFG